MADVYYTGDEAQWMQIKIYFTNESLTKATIHYNYVPTIEFTDVAADQWYAKPVAWAVEKGVTNGMTDTLFKPDNTCTRGHIVAFLYRDLAK